MAKLLYITCNLSQTKRSRSLSVGSDFIDEYQRFHPLDEVYFLDLYRDSIQRVDADVLSGWEKLAAGDSYATLGVEEQRKIGRIWRLADQFIGMDKYVFVTPMCNFGFPAEFKMYIDAICVVDKTYRIGTRGPEGALLGHGKKSLHIHTAGEFGSVKDRFCVPYLRYVLEFLGVKRQEAVVLPGGDRATGEPDESQRLTQLKLLELAARF